MVDFWGIDNSAYCEEVEEDTDTDTADTNTE